MASKNIIFYIIKQDIHKKLYFSSRLAGQAEWAEIVCGHLWVAGGCQKLKNLKNF